jgi:hypothetical protein
MFIERAPLINFNKPYRGNEMVVREQIITNGNETVSSGAALIALCFESRTKAHYAHLQTKSFAEHKALDDYYNSIIDLTDGFAESYQGRFGIIASYPEIKIDYVSCVEIIKTTRDWIDANRSDCGLFSELQNSIDNIVELCNDTIYKLTNLK